VRVDRDKKGALIGKMKIYSTVSSESFGEEPERDIQISTWDGSHLKFSRKGDNFSQVYDGTVRGQFIDGIFSRNGQGAFPFSGYRAQILTYGLKEKTVDERTIWQQKNRNRLKSLMMAGNPKPIDSKVNFISEPQPPTQFSKFAPYRDDNPMDYPQNYLLSEWTGQYRLPNPYGNSELLRTVHGYLAVPNSVRNSQARLPAVVVVNGHSGSAKQHFDSANAAYWYGDGFARRGFVVIAVDISHRDHGDDPANGNNSHPPIISPEMSSSDWEQDGERVWDTMRAIDILESLPYVDPTHITITGISMGGEVTSMTAALDLRPSTVVTVGFSPDFGVMRYHHNCPCWRWTNTLLSEYIDMSDFFALVAPRPLVVETGVRDGVFSVMSPPFASDKQVAYRTRIAYGQDTPFFFHYLHDAYHLYRAGDINPSQPNNPPLFMRTPNLIAPLNETDINWQLDYGVSSSNQTLFDFLKNH